MQIKDIQKMLELEEYKIYKIETIREEIRIRCIAKSRSLKWNGQVRYNPCEKRIREVPHKMLDRKQVILIVTQRRYSFGEKKKWEKLPGVKKQKRTTTIFRKESLLSLRDTNYQGVSEKRKVSPMFVFRLLEEAGKEIPINWKGKIKRIGIDGKGSGKKLIINVTNLDKHEIISVFPFTSQTEIIKTLKKIAKSKRLQVEEVCIDMDKGFPKVIKECFPNAITVTDHFHVIRWGLEKMENQRHHLQQIYKKNFRIRRIINKPVYELEKKEIEKLKECFAVFPEVRTS